MNDENNSLTQYDHLLKDDADVAAIVIRERLRPVQGPRGVFFPPTFAGSGQGKKSTYHIDRVGPLGGNGNDDPGDPEKASRDGVIANRCTVDSVPSQANRLESRLLRYSGTRIPKVMISGSRVDAPPLDLLEVGHRVGDAVLRYTADNGFAQFERALRAFVAGDAGPLARLAPTSLVFGHWDSRDSLTSKATKSKARRIIRSEIVAYNVARATKRSQYWSSIDPEVNEELGQILKEAKDEASQNAETKNPASQLGMTDVPAPESPGGVIAFGSIERTSIIALSGLRALAAFKNPLVEGSSDTANEPVVDLDQTLALRRYLFALALASVAGLGVWDLREGCILVRNSNPPEGKPPEGYLRDNEVPLTSVRVCHTGEETPFTVPSKTDCDAYVESAAKGFFSDGLPTIPPLTFDPTGARDAVAEKGSGGAAGQTQKKEPTKKDLLDDLMTFEENKGQKTKLGKLGVDTLREQWRTAVVADLKKSPEYSEKEQDLTSMSNAEIRELWLKSKESSTTLPAPQT